MSRSAFYGRAPLLFVGGFALLAYTASFTGANPALFLTISFTVLFLLSNLFELKGMAWFIVANLVVAILATIFFLPQIQGVDILNARAGLFTLGLFVLLFAWHRRSLEHMRLEDVARAQTELRQSNIELQNAQREANAHFSELRLAAQVGRAVSQVHDLDVLLKDACELILKEFDLYYVQVYLTAANQKSLNLEAGTGEVGAQLLRREHSLPLDINSINGRAAVEKHAIVIPDTAQSAMFRQNPLLPETRGEIAVPLIVADKVVGVLDMQSSRPGLLSNEILPAFEALAGQLAVAIQNANLLGEANEARAEVEKQARRLVRQSWGEYMDAVHTPEQIGFTYQNAQITSFTEAEQPKFLSGGDTLAAPISVSGEKLGDLTVKMEEQKRSSQMEQLIFAIARQMAQQIENLRLLESAERYRQKAELAMDRTTLERWKQYTERQQKGKIAYLYDTREVRPIEQEPEVLALTLPIKARDNTIGRFSIPGIEEQDQDSLEIVSAIVERLSSHIEALSQYDQTQSALAQSEKLFTASSQISQATDLQELVAAVVTTLNVLGMNRALLTTFEYASSGDIEQLTIIGNWWNGLGHEVTPIGTQYPREVMRVMPMFISPTPVFFNDVFHDERVDATTLELIAKRLNLCSVAVLPLFGSNKQLGALVLEGEEPHRFTQQEIRLFTSLAPQIATIMENRRQFEQAQQQAEREAMLNTISQKIQSATSVEAVLQIAARELGRALDASKAVAQLSVFKRNGGSGNNGNDHHQ
jgi:GAF domain-containing protein